MSGIPAAPIRATTPGPATPSALPTAPLPSPPPPPLPTRADGRGVKRRMEAPPPGAPVPPRVRPRTDTAGVPGSGAGAGAGSGPPAAPPAPRPALDPLGSVSGSDMSDGDSDMSDVEEPPAQSAATDAPPPIPTNLTAAQKAELITSFEARVERANKDRDLVLQLLKRLTSHAATKVTDLETGLQLAASVPTYLPPRSRQVVECIAADVTAQAVDVLLPVVDAQSGHRVSRPKREPEVQWETGFLRPTGSKAGSTLSG